MSADHNTSSAAGVWGEFAGPDLLIIDGEEITTRNGHYTALGLPAGTWIDWRYRAVDGGLARFVRDIHQAGGLAVAAHPLATCVACGWKFGFAGMDAIEVWNGPWTLDDDLDKRSILAAVKAGRLWIAESAAVNLTFTAAAPGRHGAMVRAGIGQRLEVDDDAPVTVTRYGPTRPPTPWSR